MSSLTYVIKLRPYRDEGVTGKRKRSIPYTQEIFEEYDNFHEFTTRLVQIQYEYAREGKKYPALLVIVEIRDVKLQKRVVSMQLISDDYGFIEKTVERFLARFKIYVNAHKVKA